jgi:hypothetical protein
MDRGQKTEGDYRSLIVGARAQMPAKQLGGTMSTAGSVKDAPTR